MKDDEFKRATAKQTEIPQAPKISPALDKLVEEIIRKSEARESEPRRQA